MDTSPSSSALVGHAASALTRARRADLAVDLGRRLLQRPAAHEGTGQLPAGLLYLANAVDAVIAAVAAQIALDHVRARYGGASVTPRRRYGEALVHALSAVSPVPRLPSPLALGLAAVGTSRVRVLRDLRDALDRARPATPVRSDAPR